MRDLGIYIDIYLNFAQNISIITHFGHSRAALILKCFRTRDPTISYQGLLCLFAPTLE